MQLKMFLQESAIDKLSYLLTKKCVHGQDSTIFVPLDIAACESDSCLYQNNFLCLMIIGVHPQLRRCRPTSRMQKLEN